MVAVLEPEKKINEDEFNEGIRMWYNEEFQKVLYLLEDEVKECAKDAWDLNAINKGDKVLLASVPAKLYNICVSQYGPECWKNRDFLEFYQRHAKQTFLGKPSYHFEDK